MFLLEVQLNTYWETIADLFETAQDAELYYHSQLSGFDGFRIMDAETMLVVV